MFPIPRALVSTVRTEIGRIDSQLAVEAIETMDERIGAVLAPRRFSVMALGVFAVGALLLAAIGLYGLLAFTVSERRREIAVRLAMGAEPRTILGMVVSQGLRLVSIGLAAGVVVSLVGARAVAALLYGNDGHDAMTSGIVPVVLMLVALLACGIPAIAPRGWSRSRRCAPTGGRARRSLREHASPGHAAGLLPLRHSSQRPAWAAAPRTAAMLR